MLEKINKKKFLVVLYVLFFFIFGIRVEAQFIEVTHCTNSDFSLDNFSNWTGCYGVYTNPCQTAGFDTIATIQNPSRHTIITQQSINYPNGNIDSLTSNDGGITGLHKIPPGVNQTVRLGSWEKNKLAERLTYNLIVDTNVSGLFFYSYAPVLEVPAPTCQQHTPANMPKFDIQIIDGAGVALTDTCSRFSYYVGQSGYTPNEDTIYGNGQTTVGCDGVSHIVDWFDWRTVGLSLKSFQGQNIQIQFTSYDCALGGHFGYAYFYAYCMPRQINTSFCPGGTNALLTAPYGFNYKWIPGNATTQSIIVNSPVDSTTYYCIITSIANSFCMDTLETLLVPTIINPNFQFTNECANVPVQFINTTTANTTNYNWYWNFGDPGSSGNIISMGTNVSHTYTSPGTYTVKLIDTIATGCPDSIMKTVTIYPYPTVSVSASANPICKGNSTTLTATGATSYLWSGGVLDTTNQLTVILDSTTTYTVTGTTLGCSGTDSLKITVNTYLTVNISASENPICVGKSTTLTASGALDYTWSNGFGTSNPLTVTPDSTTTYTVTGTNSGCFGTDSITITVNPNPTVSISASGNPICLGSSTTLTANGASSYLWSNGLGTTNPLTVTPSSKTIYKVTGTLLGCTGSDSITISVLPLPIVNLGNDTSICEGETLLLNAFSSGFTYLWQDNSTNSTFSVTQEGTYWVKVTDSANCTSSDTINVSMLALPTFYIPTDTTLCDGIHLNIIIPQGLPQYPNSVYWNDGTTGYENSFSLAGNYNVTVSNKCGSTYKSFTLNYKDCNCYLYFPNAFSPRNGDGLNDYFGPVYQCYFNSYHLYIYNRWGQLVFESEDPTQTWDGKYMSKDVESGVYVWKADYTALYVIGPQSKHGTVTVLR